MFRIFLKFFVTLYFILCFFDVTQSRSLYNDKSVFYPFDRKVLARRFTPFQNINEIDDENNSLEVDLRRKRRMNRRAQHFVSEYNPAPCRWKLCANYY